MTGQTEWYGQFMTTRAKVLLITSAAVFLSFLDTTVVNIAFPSIRTYFDSSPIGVVSWVLSGYNVVFAAALIPAGLLGDRIGRRRMFLAGLLGFVAASSLCAAAPDVEILLLARLLQALAAAALVPSSLALVLPEFPAERRASATALWGATGAIAAAAGPSIGGLLVEYGDWRWVFLINLPVGVAAFVTGIRALPNRPVEAVRAAVDGIAVASIVVAIGGATVGVTQGDAAVWGWTDARTLASFAVAAAAALLFLRRTTHRGTRRSDPVIDLTLFRSRSFTAAILGSLVFSVGFYALLLANVTFLTEVWKYSTIRAGLALSPSPLFAAVAAPVAGRIVDRIGSRLVAVVGATAFAAACVLYASQITADPDYLRVWLPISCLAGIGIGLSLAAFGAAAILTVPASQLGAGSALSQTARQIGAALGVASFIALFGTPSLSTVLTAFHRSWAAMAITAIASAAIATVLPSKRTAHSTTKDTTTELVDI